MKQRYKIMSILIVTALIGSVYATVQPSYTYTGCLATNNTKTTTKGMFYNLLSGTSPLASCKTGDYQISLYDKTQVDQIITSMNGQMSTLSNRVTNLEQNSSAVSGMTDTKLYSIGPGMFSITSYTFYLPADSYVAIESNGELTPDQPGLNYPDVVIALAMDRPIGSTTFDQETRRDYTLLNYTIFQPNEVNLTQRVAFQTSGIYQLKTGYHTISVVGHGASGCMECGHSVTVGPTSIIVTINQKGELIRQ